MRQRRGQVVDGLLLLDKPLDLSSNHALQRAKRLMDAQKAGHTGTLDPFATGLLICCFGKATKLAGQMLEADKGYVATMKFGQETDSGDVTGVVVSEHPAFEPVTAEKLQSVLTRFKGEQQQTPPMTSALKHKGRPLYAYAREGKEIERAPRTVNLHRLDLVACDGLTATIEVDCSKGTYIRTLAQDIGRALGVGAHLIALKRTRIGSFKIDEAWTLERLAALPDPKSAIAPLSSLPASLFVPAISNPASV
jgi:tRNA pseudouridine55 synthase